MKNPLKQLFRRVAVCLLALVLTVGAAAPAANAATGADETLCATVEEQIRSYADSIDQSDAVDDAGWALAKHGMTQGGKTLSMTASHPLAAVMMNSELLQVGLTKGCAEAIDYMQRMDLASLPYIRGGAKWYGLGASGYSLTVFNSDEYAYTNRVWSLTSKSKYSDAWNAYDDALEWMTGSATTYLKLEQVSVTEEEIVYRVNCTLKDRFDFHTSRTSGFSKWISGLGALLFREFDWDLSVTFDLTVPYSCSHSSGYYRWTYDAENKTMANDSTEGYTANGITQQTHESTDGKITYFYELDEPVRLYHDKPWVLEYDVKGTGAFTLSPLQSICSGAPCLYNYGRSYLYVWDYEKVTLSDELAAEYELKSPNASVYHYYGTPLATLFSYSYNKIYTFRLENELHGDGSNMIYLTVKNTDTGEVLLDKIAMDDYYRYESWIKKRELQEDANNWVSGKDLFISYIGNKSARFSAKYFELRIWEDGEGVEAESYYNGVVTAPTCTEGGYTTFTCACCGHSYIGEHTEKKAHNYRAVVTEPTCTAEGYTTHTCTSCGHSYTDSKTEKKAHSYQSGLCTGCGEDTVVTAVEGNTLTVTGEFEIGTRILAVCYKDGRLTGTKLLIWDGTALSETLPAEGEVKLFFTDENWNPLRPFVEP